MRRLPLLLGLFLALLADSASGQQRTLPQGPRAASQGTPAVPLPPAPRLIVAGPPGSGKSTFSRMLAEEHGMVHISAGDLLREYAKSDAIVADQMSRGELVDAQLVLRLVRQRLARPDAVERGFVIEGFPRKQAEALEFERMIQDGLALDGVIALDVPEEELLRRVLARGRNDDSEAVFRERLRIYHEQTLPALSRLRERVKSISLGLPDGDKESNYARLQASLGSLFDGQAALLARPEQGLAARQDLIASARRTIDAAYYQFYPDQAGLALLAMLRQAARRGVRVRLTLDYWGNRLPRAMLRHLAKEGVEVRLYHPFRSRKPSSFTERLHDKWLVVDGEEAILGDRNIAEKYLGMGRAPWRTRELYIKGKAAGELKAYARALWASREVSRPVLGKGAQGAARAARLLDAHELAPAPALSRTGLKPPRMVREARLSSNPIDKTQKRGTGDDLLGEIAKARESIEIVNPYVILNEPFWTALAAARERGVNVKIITNSKRSNNFKSVYAAYSLDVKRMAGFGFELWEYQGPGTLHAKNMVIDGRTVYVGSFNLDPRSFELNLESGFIVRDERLAKELLAEFREDERRSRLVAKGGIRLGRPDEEWLAVRWIKTLFFWLALLFFRRQL